MLRINIIQFSIVCKGDKIHHKYLIFNTIINLNLKEL